MTNYNHLEVVAQPLVLTQMLEQQESGSREVTLDLAEDAGVSFISSQIRFRCPILIELSQTTRFEAASGIQKCH
jgi:hypothetical protein